MNKNFLLLVLFFCNFLFSQKKPHYLINLEYTNQKNNTVGFGPELYFVNKNKQITVLNGNLMYTIENGQFFPEISINQHFNIKFLNPYSSNIKSNFLNIGFSVSTEYFRPEFGINFLDVLTLKSGYNFNIKEQSIYEGAIFSLNLHVPIIAL